jgi:hypothetical protein
VYDNRGHRARPASVQFPPSGSAGRSAGGPSIRLPSAAGAALTFRVTFTICVEGQASAGDAVKEAAVTLQREDSDVLVRMGSARRVTDDTLPLTRHAQPRARVAAQVTRSLGGLPLSSLGRPLWWPYALTFQGSRRAGPSC